MGCQMVPGTFKVNPDSIKFLNANSGSPSIDATCARSNLSTGGISEAFDSSFNSDNAVSVSSIRNISAKGFSPSRLLSGVMIPTARFLSLSSSATRNAVTIGPKSDPPSVSPSLASTSASSVLFEFIYLDPMDSAF
jgi:hypothetical protein